MDQKGEEDPLWYEITEKGDCCKTCDVHLFKDGCHFTYHREQNN
jgi:hypothetical protein